MRSLDILLIGDYGWTLDMTDPNHNFDAINSYVGNLTSQGGKIDFIMTTGDNIYVRNESYPSLSEADLMMTLFQKRANLKDLTIYPIRGNHDCYAKDPYFEVNLTKRYSNWEMPSLYYERLFDIGGNKKLGVLFVDTCLAICGNYTYGEDHISEDAPHEIREMKRLMDVKCDDQFSYEQGR